MASVDPSGLDTQFYTDGNCNYFTWDSSDFDVDGVLQTHNYTVSFGKCSGGNSSPQTNQANDGAPPAAPNNITCNTKLPNGQTIGAVVRQQRAILQSTLQGANDAAANGVTNIPLASLYGEFFSIASPHGPIDFKKGQTGQAFVQMGFAGNFAYYAIGAGYFSPSTLDAGAGGYGLIAAAFLPHSTVHFSDLTGNFFSDSAAAKMRGPGFAANGCSVP